MTKAIKHIGFGTAAIGRPQYINIRTKETQPFNKAQFKQQGIDILEAAYSKGIRYFDTAPGYGMAEQILIDWLKTKDDNSIEIATKWGYSYVANFDPNATVHEIKDHRLSQLLIQFEKSKELLPFLTTYQIHSATLDTGVLDNLGVLSKLSELRDEFGLKIGITTTGNNQIDVLKKALDVEVDDRQLFDVFQVTYNILDQSLNEISNELTSQGKRIVVKEALANGRLFRNLNYLNYRPLYDALESMANKHGVGVDAIALAFCKDTLKPFKVLSGASEKVQLAENLKSVNISLEEEEIEILKSFKVNPFEYWCERKQLGWN